MRKVLSWICLLLLTLSLAACGVENDNDITNESEDSIEQESNEPKEESDNEVPSITPTTEASVTESENDQTSQTITDTISDSSLLTTTSTTASTTATSAVEGPTNYVNEVRVEEGYLAPDFTVTLLDGSTTTLSSLQGHPVLLNFWASWCGPCCGELPAFERLQSEYGSNLTVLAIDCGEDSATISDYIGSYGYTFKVGLDQDGTISSLYPTNGIPYSIIIDSYGIIRHISVGASDADSMYTYYKDCIDSL